jgi:transposase-like protein
MAGKGKLSPEQIQAAVDLYRSGLSVREVAARFDIAPQSMHGLLKRRTEMRSASGNAVPIVLTTDKAR